MCYSAMVEQRHKEWLRNHAEIAEQAFETLFRRRLSDSSIKLAKALEASYQGTDPSYKKLGNGIYRYEIKG